MSQIVAEVHDAFRAANVREDLAKAATSVIADREDLLTNLDLEGGVNHKFGYGPAILGLLTKLVLFP